MKQDIYLLRELLQEAKGLGGVNVESHLDAAENHLDHIESITTELAEALEEAYWDRTGWVSKAKAVLKKMGR